MQKSLTHCQSPLAAKFAVNLKRHVEVLCRIQRTKDHHRCCPYCHVTRNLLTQRPVTATQHYESPKHMNVATAAFWCSQSSIPSFTTTLRQTCSRGISSCNNNSNKSIVALIVFLRRSQILRLLPAHTYFLQQCQSAFSALHSTPTSVVVVEHMHIIAISYLLQLTAYLYEIELVYVVIFHGRVTGGTYLRNVKMFGINLPFNVSTYSSVDSCWWPSTNQPSSS